MSIKSLIGFVIVLASSTAWADHHKGVAEAAQSGQVIAIYHWPCADLEMGLELLTEMNEYERRSSPVPYSAVAATHDDGALASVDVHVSAASFTEAAMWQDSDAEWQRIFAEMVIACGSAEDLSVKLLTIK